MKALTFIIESVKKHESNYGEDWIPLIAFTFCFPRVSAFFIFLVAVFVDFLFINSVFMHCVCTHKFHFSVIFSLKIGLTVLFTHLKIILLQCFQFKVSAKQVLSKQTHISYGARLKFYHIKIKKKKRKSKLVFSFPYFLIIGICSSWCSPWFIYVEKRKRNAGDTHFYTIFCHNSPHGELWLVRVCPYMAH